MGLFNLFKRSQPDSPTEGGESTGDDALSGEDDPIAQADDGTASAGTAATAAVEVPAGADAQESDDDEEFEAPPKEAPRDRAENGPFDAEESAPTANRLDLGALSVPVIDGMQIRLETEEKSDRVLAVTLVHGKAAMQLQVFAAPRGEGIWKSVRDEIAAGVRRRRGKADELYTDLGYELVSQLPVRAKDGRTGVRITRFAGVDGPRWFLRAVFSGAAVTEKESRDALAGLLRGTIVDRGTEAMPPRELLALTPPRVRKNEDGTAQIAQESDDPQAEGPQADDDLNPFERGPEIAEVR